MRSLSDTITRLQRSRGANLHASDIGSSRLQELTDFGSNPGALKAWAYLPDVLPSSAPLVVVLHGCTQTAAGYDRGSGWSEMADRHGFALLFPEQTRANNANLCFNWFEPGDTRRDAGEALSIRQMIGALVEAHDLDGRRVFVTGLSAGGAMTSVMLATYPEVFASGAIIAGLPYACARSVPEALDRMRGHGGPDERKLQMLLRGASDYQGPWPTISVWQGSADHTVVPGNAAAIVAQWRGVHGLSAQPTRTETIDGYPRRIWAAADGRVLIEEIIVTGMGHGTPLSVDGVGAPGAHMLNAGISSTEHIAHFWGLTDGVARVAPRSGSRPAEAPTAASGPGKVIEDALRAAGLMR